MPLIDELLAEDASYVDPLTEVHGRDAMDATVAAAQAQFPDSTFTLAEPVDAHHEQARFTWALGPDGAEPVVVGFDVAVRDGNGQLTARPALRPVDHDQEGEVVAIAATAPS